MNVSRIEKVTMNVSGIGCDGSSNPLYFFKVRMEQKENVC